MLRCVPRVLVVLIAVVLAFGAVASAQNDAEPRTLVPGPPKPAPSPVTLNAYNALVKANQVVLSGSTTGAVSVEAAGPAGVVTAPVVNGQFTITAPLLPDRLNRVFVTGIASNGVRGAPATANVTRDNQAPELHVDFPGDGELIQTQFSPADPRIDVGGRVADLLSGYRFLAVSINGQPAEVDVGIGTNGTFFLPDVPIQRDATTVIAVNARDALGNAVATQISVTHATLPPADNQMARISGNAQTGPVNQVLPQPLVARVFRKNPAGQGILPFFGKQVTFEVARSNGTLSTSPTGPWTQSVQVESDSFGDARVYWKLGGDAGCGNQRVKARSLGILGTVGFCASASPAGALQLNIGTGNNQMAEVGATLPEPLRAWVSDGCNGVAGVPVTFTVTEGNGRILDQTVFTTFTTQTGHAFANVEVGSVGNNRIEVNFPGNPNDPAVFVATGVSRDQPSTSFVGIVLNNAELPIEGAEVWLTIPNYASAPVLTDCNGVFRIENLPSGGPGFLHVEGATAYHVGGCNGAGVNVLAGSFPALHFEVVVTPQTRNSLPRPALLPPLNPANARSYSTTQDTVLTVEEITGLQMVIKAGSMTLPNGLPAPDGTLVSLNKVNHDKVPMPMPDGAAPPFAWTLQPGGSTFNPPIQITYPNMSGLPPGAITNFLSYNHDTERFEIVASGAVDSQGFSITTDPGSGLSLAGWGCNCPPYSITSDCCGDDGDCPSCDRSDSDPCCDKRKYDSATHGCCNKSIYTLATEGCCQTGVLSYTVYSKSTNCCVPGLLFNKVVAKNPIADLDDCPNRVPKVPAWVFQYDGCSAPSAGAMNLLCGGFNGKDNPTGHPNTVFGNGTGLMAPCDGHDRCYQTCNAAPNAQANCDTAMHTGMNNVCNNSGAPANIIQNCLCWSDKYKLGLDWFGKSHFEARQKEVCDCCN